MPLFHWWLAIFMIKFPLILVEKREPPAQQALLHKSKPSAFVLYRFFK